MAESRRYVFLSYASSQRERALAVARALEDHGVSVWLDRQAIPGGTSWSAEIVRGIKGCAAVIVLCSTASLTSPNVHRELNLAVEDERPLLPLILEPATAPDEVRYALAGRQWIELLDRPDEEWLPRVLDALSRFGISFSPGEAVELGPADADPPTPTSLPPPLPIVAPPASSRPYWSQVLRALREARGITQDAWAARLGISRTTIQRWERGEYVPDAAGEEELLRVCREQGLFRAFDRGPLAGLTMSPGLLGDLLAEARLGDHASGAGDAVANAHSAADTDSGPVAARASNLPVPTTSFIGREAESEAVVQLVRAGRHVTLSGPGGSGKTRLALHVAAVLLPELAGGVSYVDLAAFDDPGLVLQAISEALGVRDAGGQPYLERLESVLRDKELLLVLDNFEHVVAGTTALPPLLAKCPRLKLLVTSRIVLRLSGEREYPVPPLPLPDGEQPIERVPSVALFVERARDVHPGFASTAVDLATVGEICGRLDGLPLAIELAAARVRLFSVDALLQRLDSRLKLLVRGPRDAPLRHQTLRSTIAWSHDLLTTEEQAVFARLAVFQGGCTLEAAEAVCADEDGEIDVLEALASLREQSLVQEVERPEGIRLRLLETIREFGLEQLGARGEEPALRRRHCECYLALAEEADALIRGPRRVHWTDRLHAERDNIRAALAWCVEAGEATLGLRLIRRLDQWYTSRFIGEGLRWGEAMLALPGEAEPSIDRGRVLGIVAGVARGQGRLAEARDWATQSAGVCRSLGDTVGLARALTWAWYLERELGREDDAILDEILALARASHDAILLANALLLPSMRRLGDDAANAALEESYRLATEVGDPHLMSQVLLFRGRVALLLRQHTDAVALLERALTLASELGNQIAIWLFRADLIIAVAERGDVARSLQLCEQFVVEARRDGVDMLPSLTLDMIGGTLQEAGESRGAARLFAAAEAFRGGGPPNYATPYSAAFVIERTSAARAALGDHAYDLAQAQGRLLPPQEARAEGLALLREAQLGLVAV